MNQIIVYVCYDGVKLDKFQNGEGTAVEIVREKKTDRRKNKGVVTL